MHFLSNRNLENQQGQILDTHILEYDLAEGVGFLLVQQCLRRDAGSPCCRPGSASRRGWGCPPPPRLSSAAGRGARLDVDAHVQIVDLFGQRIAQRDGASPFR